MRITKKLRNLLREEWLLALEGKLLGADGKPLMQGTGLLRMEDKEGTFYCCLGVACEVARRHGLLPDGEVARRDRDPHGTQVASYSYSTSTMPQSVVDLFGFTDADGGFTGPLGRETLAWQNDHCASFEEIARNIRSGEWKVWADGSSK